MGYKRYERYKDSGVDWIGEVPEGWEIRKFKYMVQQIVEKSKDVDNEKLYIGLEDIEQETGKIKQDITKKEQITESQSLLFEKNDVLFGKLRPYLAKCVIAKFPGKCTSELLVLRANNNISSKYLYYFILSNLFIDKVNSSTYGAKMPRANWSFIGNLPIILPKLLEQNTIIDFLDQKIAEIDSLIADKEKMVQLLQEMRQAIISEAVTKGLDKNVKMKDSGVEWIGEIPEHWEVKKLRFLCKIETGNKDTQDSDENGIYPFFVRSDTIEYINSYSFDGEAILTAGDGVGVARVFHYINGKFDFHQRVYKISDFKEISGKLLFYYIKENLYKEVIKISAKSTVDSLRMPMFKNFPVVYDKNESNQQKIVNYLDRNTSAIDMIINKTQLQIEKLHEYRQSLISEAVTGKIDVRDFMHSTEGGVQNGCNAG